MAKDQLVKSRDINHLKYMKEFFYTWPEKPNEIASDLRICTYWVNIIPPGAIWVKSAEVILGEKVLQQVTTLSKIMIKF